MAPTGLVVRRLGVRRGLLAGVVVLVVVGSTLLGTCALLLTATRDRAFAVDVRARPPDDLAVTAYLVAVPGADAAAAGRDARRVVADALAPLRPTTSAEAVSGLRRLEGAGPDALGYLASSEDPRRRAVLVSGRWPRAGTAPGAPVEAVVPESAAADLGLAPGGRARLGGEVGGGSAQRPEPLLVVGTFRPRSRAGWEQDPLAGAGVDAAYTDGTVAGPAYGPFLVDPAALLASGSTIASMQVTGSPSPGAVTRPSLAGAAASLGAADGRLEAVLGDRAGLARVGSDLPATLEQVRAQQAAATSTVAVVALLGASLTVAALLLAGGATSSARADEHALLVTLGAGRRQLLAVAAGEAALLAVLAAAVAVPASALAHAGLTHLPVMARAGLAQGPAVTAALVATVVVAALVLSAALVVPALRRERAVDPAGGAGSWARGSVATRAAARAVPVLALAALAVAAGWQLRSTSGVPGPGAAGGGSTSGDLVRVVAPVLCLGAAAWLVVLVAPLLPALLARRAAASRTLVLPLALLRAARRPQGAAASFLLVAAVAAATLGLGLGSTWQRSQVDQAALAVGTDLSLTPAGPVSAGQGAALARAAGGEVSAVTSRPAALGRYLGEPGDAPTLVALDARRAGALLRGRGPTGRGWEQVASPLVPRRPVVGLPLPAGGAGITLRGASTTDGGDASGADGAGVGPGAAALLAVPTLVVQDGSGLRTTLGADPVPLDGRAHPLRWSAPPPAGQRLVAVRYALGLDPDAADGAGGFDATDGGGTGAAGGGTVRVDVALGVPAAGRPGDAWSGTVLDREDLVPGLRVAAAGQDGAAVVRVRAALSRDGLAYADAQVLATAFAPVTSVPAVVSQRLSDALGVAVGDRLTVGVDGTGVRARVAEVVPTVPSAPGRSAVLVDGDALSRALLGAGDLDPAVDAWWVGRPDPGAAARVRALGLGEVTTLPETAERLASGPLRVTVPAVLLVLVAAAVALVLIGTAVLVSADLGARALETARLRALGLPRRTVVAVLALQHGAGTALLVLLGAAVGTGAAAVLGPALVRSEVGRTPVPTPAPSWPVSVPLLVAALVAGCAALVAVAALAHVRRSEVAHLRLGGG